MWEGSRVGGLDFKPQKRTVTTGFQRPGGRWQGMPIARLVAPIPAASLRKQEPEFANDGCSALGVMESVLRTLAAG